MILILFNLMLMQLELAEITIELFTLIKIKLIKDFIFMSKLLVEILMANGMYLLFSVQVDTTLGYLNLDLIKLCLLVMRPFQRNFLVQLVIQMR
nr:MAG TPA: hypothetical protein [Caudoviricetes sp.]